MENTKTLYDLDSKEELDNANTIMLDYMKYKGSYYGEKNGVVYVMNGVPYLAWQDSNMNIHIKQMPYKLSKDLKTNRR